MFLLNSSNYYLDEIKINDITITGFNVDKYKIVINEKRDYSNNTLTINYYLVSLDGSIVSPSKEILFTGFKQDTYDISSILNIEGLSKGDQRNEGSQFEIYVSLTAPIHYKLEVNIAISGATTNVSSLLFNKDDYGNKKSIIITLNHDETSYLDKESKIVFSRKDEEFISIPFIIKNVDMKAKNSFIAPQSLELENLADLNFSFKIKNKLDENTLVSLTPSEGLSLSSSSLLINSIDYDLSQLVTITANISNRVLDSYNCTITITANNFNTFVIYVLVKVTKEPTQSLVPVHDGYINDPVHYYTAFYETDYSIDKMFVSINNEEYFDLSTDSYSSFTSSYCLIYIPFERYGNSPTIKLKTTSKPKQTKISGTPIYSLEGYKIKATVGDYSEYYSPFFSKPTILINISTQIEVKNYVHFEREGNDFYLPLSKTSSSRIVDENGFSPVDQSKIFKVSGSRKRPFYDILASYYAKNNSPKDMTFVDTADKTNSNYSMWRRCLERSIRIFNEFFVSNDLEISIREVNEGQSKNAFEYYEDNEVNYGGMCKYYSNQNYFSIYINASPFMIHNDDQLVSTIVHEMGHLLGFPDSAYSLNDSLYSYSNYDDEAAYFSPNDIATYRNFIGK